MALDQLREVGPGGHFISHDYTLRNFRRLQWHPRLTTRVDWDRWQEAFGGQDMRQRANAAARQILAQHHPHPLTDEQVAELDEMARAFQARAMERAGGR